MKSGKTTKQIHVSLGLIISTVGLTSCSYFGGDSWNNYHAAPDYRGPGYRTQPYMPAYGSPHHQPGPSHHFSEGGGKPVKHADRDSGWVQSQNPQEYTLEIARDARPEVVADSLHKAPKDARQAQIKAGDQYEAIYGSYPTREAAEAARDQLPANLRDSSQVKQWDSVQKSMTE